MIVNALPCHQSRRVRHTGRDRVGDRQAIPRDRWPDRVASVDLGSRHDLALARYARPRAHGGARNRHVLVRNSFAADVPIDPGAVAARVWFLVCSGLGLRPDRPPVQPHGLGWTEAWTEALVPTRFFGQ